MLKCYARGEANSGDVEMTKEHPNQVGLSGGSEEPGDRTFFSMTDPFVLIYIVHTLRTSICVSQI
jgi:hypothetical protein